MSSVRSSIATRLAALFAAVALAGFSLISVTLYWVLTQELDRHQMDQIQSRMDDMRYMLTHYRAHDIADRARNKIDALTPTDGHNRYWLWSLAPEFCYGDDLEQVLAMTRAQPGMAEWRSGERLMRVAGLNLPATANRPAVRLMVGMDFHPFAQTLHSVMLALMILTLLGTAAVALAGYWVARLGLLPVMRLSEEAHRIEPGNPGQRLQLPALPQELADLGVSFNAALDRLDAAYHHLATFNDNVAHELRTPLANLIGLTQVALSRERDGPRLREVLQSNLEELERLRSIVADMLFLARAEQGERASDMKEMALATEVAKTLEFMELLFDEAGMTVRVVGEAHAPVQTALFRRALTNLLHNALQHSQKGSEIGVYLTSDGLHAEVAVQNPGAEIPARHLDRLFDRFYRADESRANSGESHGLGLAIVKAVAQMHKGTVFVTSAQGQTRVGFTVNVQAQAPRKTFT